MYFTDFCPKFSHLAAVLKKKKQSKEPPSALMALMGEALISDARRGMSFTLSALEKWRYFADGCFCELQL